MKAAPNATTREIAALGAVTRRQAVQRPTAPGGIRRKLRIVELRDGRAQLVEAGGALFMPCASPAVAERMHAVFST